jgi:hypothetical protein
VAVVEQQEVPAYANTKVTVVLVEVQLELQERVAATIAITVLQVEEELRTLEVPANLLKLRLLSVKVQHLPRILEIVSKAVVAVAAGTVVVLEVTPEVAVAVAQATLLQR